MALSKAQDSENRIKSRILKLELYTSTFFEGLVIKRPFIMVFWLQTRPKLYFIKRFTASPQSRTVSVITRDVAKRGAGHLNLAPLKKAKNLIQRGKNKLRVATRIKTYLQNLQNSEKIIKIQQNPSDLMINLFPVFEYIFKYNEIISKRCI